MIGAWLLGCASDPAPPAPKKGEGEGCQVTTECAANLSCLDGVCATPACSVASECTGDPGSGCRWACVADRCAAACSPDGGVSPRDAAPAADALPAADATAARDATPPADAAPFADAAGLDATAFSDAVVAMDAVVAPDAGACAGPARAPLPGELLVNEIHASPANSVAGDANGDGTRDAADDEFIEIGNIGASPLELGGVILSDSTSLRHTFLAGVLDCGKVIVVFGGGNTGLPSWRSNWVIASSGALSLNNGGDQVRLGSSAATPDDLASTTFGTSDGQSLVRMVDLSSSTSFVLHGAAAGSGGALFSPGVRTNGTPF